ncbi:transmembrane protein 69-like [Aulostomus maculatus]
MLSFILRRSSVTAQKVLHWAGPQQRCWTSVVAGAPDGGPGSWGTCWSTERAATVRERRSAAVHGFLRPATFPRNPAAAFLIKNCHFHSSAVRLKKRPLPEPPPRELDLLRYDMKDLWNAPKPALVLGFAGLIPFVFPPLFMGMIETYYPQLAYAQVAYGASILSFLGGVRWGFALPESSPAKPDWINLFNSVVPSLLAWVAMLLTGGILPSVMMIILGLGVSLHYDLSLLPTYPSWFKALRSVLTLVAFLSLVGTLVLQGFYPEKTLY